MEVPVVWRAGVCTALHNPPPESAFSHSLSHLHTLLTQPVIEITLA